MNISSMITVDSRSVEHLDLEEGFLSFLTGYVLKHYGEQIAWRKHPADQPYFVALYFLDDGTWVSSKLVDPEFFKNQQGTYVLDEEGKNEDDYDEEEDEEFDENTEEDFEYMSDEPFSDKNVVISALASTQLMSDPAFVGYATHIILDTHYES